MVDAKPMDISLFYTNSPSVYTFVVAASLSSTYFHVRLRRLLTAASVFILNANWYIMP